MTVYYAHCVALYDTPQEARDLALLERLVDGGVVFNPNNPVTRSTCEKIREAVLAENPDADPGATVMEYFKNLVHGADLFVFRALPDGFIPAGVAKELAWAQEFGVPVLELPSCVLRRTLEVSETREYLREVGHR